jgi:hypothetical protein
MSAPHRSSWRPKIAAGWRRTLELLFPARLARPGWGYAFREMLWALVITTVALSIEHWPVVRSLELIGLDAIEILIPKSLGDEITVVQITDADFADPKLFAGHRPLDPRVVQTLVDKLASAHPKVIGVDLDIVDPDFRQPSDVPVVWSRDIEPPNESNRGEAVIPRPILGLDPHRPQPPSGICVLPLDRDGVVRRYVRHFEIAGPLADATGHDHMDSFAWKLYGAYRPEAVHDGAHMNHSLILRYRGDRYDVDHLNAGEVMRLADLTGWTDNPLIKGRIVLLGGAFADARDEYQTPVGRMTGVELTAQVIRSEMSGGVEELALYISGAIDLIAAAILVYLSWRFEGVASFLASIVVIGAAFVGVSYLVFCGLAYWFNFPLVMFGILLHLQIEHLRERRHHALAAHRTSHH